MVKATLLGLEPTTSASQRAHCPPDVRLAPLLFLSLYLSFLHLFSSFPCHSLSPSVSFIHLSLVAVLPWPCYFNGLCWHFQPCHGSLACFPSKFKERWFLSSPLFTLLFEMHWCFHSFIPGFHSSYSLFIHASLWDCASSVLTFKFYWHDFLSANHNLRFNLLIWT